MSLPHSHGILLFLLCLETRRAGKTDASVARRKDEAFGGCAFQVKTAFFILFNSRISSDLIIVLFHPLICPRKWFCSRNVSLSLVFCMKKRKNVNQNTPFAAFFFISIAYSLVYSCNKIFLLPWRQMNDLKKGQDDHNRQELKLLSRYHTNRDELQRFVVFFPVPPLTQLLNISCQDFFFASFLCLPHSLSHYL